ncbi:hypothetical protein [Kocuria palustris]
MQRLEAEDVIRGYQAVVDPAALGQRVEVLLDIGLTGVARGSIEAFESLRPTGGARAGRPREALSRYLRQRGHFGIPLPFQVSTRPADQRTDAKSP